MERRASTRKTVLMSGALEFAGSTKNCLIRNMSISGAELDVTGPLDIPERFDLVFRAVARAFPVTSSGARTSRSAWPSTSAQHFSPLLLDGSGRAKPTVLRDASLT
jgi:hypothetical protein